MYTYTQKEELAVSLNEEAKLRGLYELARKIAPAAAMRLVRQTQDDEERRFYAFIAEMNLQRAQKIAIKNNLF